MSIRISLPESPNLSIPYSVWCRTTRVCSIHATSDLCANVSFSVFQSQHIESRCEEALQLHFISINLLVQSSNWNFFSFLLFFRFAALGNLTLMNRTPLVSCARYSCPASYWHWSSSPEVPESSPFWEVCLLSFSGSSFPLMCIFPSFSARCQCLLLTPLAQQPGSVGWQQRATRDLEDQ